MTQEQYSDAMPQRGRPRLKVFCNQLLRKDTCRANAAAALRGIQGGIFSLNVGGTTKYAKSMLSSHDMRSRDESIFYSL